MSRPQLLKRVVSVLEGGSEKQFIDALRVYEVQHRDLDLAYLEPWVRVLKVETLWRRIKLEAVVV